MQRQRRAATERATYKEAEEAPVERALEEEVIIGRRKKPPSLIAHIVSSVTPKDSDVRRWETLAVLGFLHEFHPSFAVTIDPLALCSALSCGSKPDSAASTLIRELHLFLLRGISRGRAPVTTETWERVLSNRLNERIDELSEFSYQNPMAAESDAEESLESSSKDGPGPYFNMTTEQRVRVLYLLTCWQLELSSTVQKEVEKREGGEGNGTIRLDPLGQDHAYHAYWHFASWPALLFREDEKLWDVPHKPEGRWQIVCSSLEELESFTSALEEATRDEKTLRDVVQEVAIEPLQKEARAREAAERRQAHAARHLGVNSNNIVSGQRSRRVASYRFEDLVGGNLPNEPVLDRAARQKRREEEATAARMRHLGVTDESKSSDEEGNGHVRRKAALRGQENRRAQQKRGPPQRWGRRGSDSEPSVEESIEYGSESDEKERAKAEEEEEKLKAGEEEEEEEASSAVKEPSSRSSDCRIIPDPAKKLKNSNGAEREEADGAAKDGNVLGKKPRVETESESQGPAKNGDAPQQTEAPLVVQPAPEAAATSSTADVVMKEAAPAAVSATQTV